MLDRFQWVRAKPRFKLDQQMGKNSYRNVIVTDDGDGEDKTTGEVTVGVNQNDFGRLVVR